MLRACFAIVSRPFRNSSRLFRDRFATWFRIENQQFLVVFCLCFIKMLYNYVNSNEFLRNLVNFVEIKQIQKEIMRI